jgi:chemotaxis protein MotB
MYAISSVNQQKYYALNTSLNEAFNHDDKMPPASPTIKVESPKSKSYSEVVLHDMANTLASHLSAFIMDGKVRVIESKVILRVDLQESLLFEGSTNKLSQDAKRILETIATVLKKSQRQIEIEAHTDNEAITDSQYASNWSYSAARASALVEILSEAGVAADRRRAIGFAASLPVEANTSPLGRARNRRVSIVILNEPERSYEGLEVSPKGMY